MAILQNLPKAEHGLSDLHLAAALAINALRDTAAYLVKMGLDEKTIQLYDDLTKALQRLKEVVGER